MPIYEYLCESCGRVSEVMQKVSDPPPGSCPSCGGSKLAKLISRTAFQLKGGGWYADLYGSPRDKGKGAGAEAKAEPSAAASAPAASPPSEGAAPAAPSTKPKTSEG